MKRTDRPGSELPVLSKAVLEQERKMLLDLGNDITSVRDRDDLLFLFSKRIKSLFYFTHTIVTLIDDLTGEEAEDISTVEFALEGISYEIDLANDNAADTISAIISLSSRFSELGSSSTAGTAQTTKMAMRPSAYFSPGVMTSPSQRCCPVSHRTPTNHTKA